VLGRSGVKESYQAVGLIFLRRYQSKKKMCWRGFVRNRVKKPKPIKTLRGYFVTLPFYSNVLSKKKEKKMGELKNEPETGGERR